MKKDVRKWLLVCAFGAQACLEEPQQIGPGTSIVAPSPAVDAKVGGSGEVVAQVLDANGEGVDGAYVTFTRTDSSRLEWTGNSVSGDASSIKTRSATTLNVTGHGIAVVPFKVPSDAEAGELGVIAVLKGPAKDDATIAVRITVKITASEPSGGGTGGAGGGGGNGANGGSGGTAGADGGDIGAGG